MTQQAPLGVTNNGATNLFRTITTNHMVLTPGFNNLEAFNRAMKVFVMSYPEMFTNPTPFMTSKLIEYHQTMQFLYEVIVPNMSYLQQIHNQISTLQMQIWIAAKRISGGLGAISNAKLRFRLGNTLVRRDLDVSRDYQIYNPMVLVLPFDQFSDLRRNASLMLNLDIEETGPPINAVPLNTFSFVVANSHPEGFEDWVDFGRGVQILINIEFKVANEPNMTANNISLFHIYTIYFMLKKRLAEYGARKGYTDIGHQITAFKYDVSYHRPYVTPQTDEMLWSTTTRPRGFSGFVADSMVPRRRTATVKFVDIQIGFMTNENLEDRVCLCNEWCNLNAFFHYNPIYRFLLVRHHQLFLKNMANIPEMYLSLSTLYSCTATPTVKVPLLRLMNCANEYRKRYLDQFEMKHSQRTLYIHQYRTSHPLPTILLAYAYNKLRYEIDMTLLCHQMNANPFAEICSESLIIYYKVLTETHVYHTSNLQLVANKADWYRDLDTICRNKYGAYFKKSYDTCFANVPGGYDFMFTVDDEYAHKFIGTDDLRQIKQIRDTVLMKSRDITPFNMRITLNQFLNTFVSISKFLSGVGTRLPRVYRSEAMHIIVQSNQNCDSDMQQFLTHVTRRTAGNAFDYQFDSSLTGYQNFDENFHVFYTLKLYSYAFEVQKNCIQSVAQWVKRFIANKTQICAQYNFFWTQLNVLIEQTYRNTYPGHSIFSIHNNFEALFNDFYNVYWGKAQHELNFSNILQTNLDSAYFEYQRLYFWMKNGGNFRRRFIEITRELVRCLRNITKSSRTIALDYIYRPIVRLYNDNPNGNYLQVFDELMYFLVKADCSMVLSTTATFFKQIHELQDTNLSNINVTFSMSKPGWLPLFETFSKVMQTIKRIEDLYIAFEDEFDRIANTCLQTRTLIKSIYRQLYNRLGVEWISEMEQMYIRMTPTQANGSELIMVHLANGLLFTTRFVNQFRESYRMIRKNLMTFLEFPPDPNVPHQVEFAGCLQTVKNFLQDKNAIHSQDKPLQTNHWRTRLGPLLAQWDQLTEQQLNIDLNASK